MPDFVRIYALTPGAAHTVELIAETVGPDENIGILDELIERHTCW